MRKFDPPGSRTEAILQNMLGANNVLEPPQSRVEELLQEILESGGDSSNAVLYTAQSLTDSQKAQARTNIGAASEVREAVSGTSVNLDPEIGYRYVCGELTALTVTSSPGTGGWSVRFTCGSTATVLTMPNTVVMPDGFEVEASTVYEINVLDNYALVASWPVASS